MREKPKYRMGTGEKVFLSVMIGMPLLGILSAVAIPALLHQRDRSRAKPSTGTAAPIVSSPVLAPPIVPNPSAGNEVTTQPVQNTGNSYSYKFEPSAITLHGVLVSGSGEGTSGEKIAFPALQLDTAIEVVGTANDALNSETEKGVNLIQLVLNSNLSPTFLSLKGRPVTVEGSLFHSQTGHHYTSVLMTPTAITPR